MHMTEYDTISKVFQLVIAHSWSASDGDEDGKYIVWTLRRLDHAWERIVIAEQRPSLASSSFRLTDYHATGKLCTSHVAFVEMLYITPPKVFAYPRLLRHAIEISFSQPDALHDGRRWGLISTLFQQKQNRTFMLCCLRCEGRVMAWWTCRR